MNTKSLQDTKINNLNTDAKKDEDENTPEYIENYMKVDRGLEEIENFCDTK
jgi:hypothetical protein